MARSIPLSFAWSTANLLKWHDMLAGLFEGFSNSLLSLEDRMALQPLGVLERLPVHFRYFGLFQLPCAIFKSSLYWWMSLRDSVVPQYPPLSGNWHTARFFVSSLRLKTQDRLLEKVKVARGSRQ